MRVRPGRVGDLFMPRTKDRASSVAALSRSLRPAPVSHISLSCPLVIEVYEYLSSATCSGLTAA